MREILFRGKRIDNGEWVEGGFAEIPAPPCCFGEPGKPSSCIVAADNRYQPDWNLPYKMAMYEVDPATVGQYTGLTDKNGVKIFEGDTCKDSAGFVFEVQWDSKDARFLGRHAKPRGDTYICYVGRIPAVEVIGNVHDNPELREEAAHG